MNTSRDQWGWGLLGFGLGLVVGAAIVCVLVEQKYHDNIPNAIGLVINFFVAVGTIAAACFAALGFLQLKKDREPNFVLRLDTDANKQTSNIFKIDILNLNTSLVCVSNLAIRATHPLNSQLAEYSIVELNDLPAFCAVNTPPIPFKLRLSGIVDITENLLKKHSNITALSEKIHFINNVRFDLIIITKSSHYIIDIEENCHLINSDCVSAFAARVANSYQSD